MLSSDPKEIDRVRKEVAFDKAKARIYTKMGASIK
jgi:hypothetical protein